MKPILICLLGLSVSALSNELPDKLQQNLTFHLSFEETIEAGSAAGNTNPKQSPSKMVFSEGVTGKAGVLGATSIPKLQYEHAGNLDIVEGTLSFWVKPLDWEESGSSIIPLFQLGVANEGYIGLQVADFSEDKKGRRLMFYALNFKTRRKNAKISGDMEWKDGVWRQVVLTWSGDKVKLYTDRGFSGEVTLSQPLQSGEITWPYFYLGGGNIGMAIDEVRIWNRALSDEEVGLFQNQRGPKE